MKIHKEGYGIICIVAFLPIAFWVLHHFFFPDLGNRALWIYILLFLFLLFSLLFFRSPKREIHQDTSVVLSPADGRIVVVEETLEKEFFKKKMLQVSIFMSPIDIHLNRYPVSGRVLYKKHHPGKHLMAWNPKSSSFNERTSIAFETREGQQILLHQVAGFMARRISCYSEEGLEVIQGEELGFIKYGSRVDLYLPLDVKLEVKIGDMVKGGIHTIARF